MQLQNHLISLRSALLRACAVFAISALPVTAGSLRARASAQEQSAAPAYYLPSSSYDYGVGGFLLAGAQIVDLPTHGVHGKRRSISK